MDSDIIEVVTGWESTPISGGYDGLRTLADQGFTGAVSEGMVWAFVLNGKVVGVFDGDITAFEDADGTAYHAPDPALPLLYAMQETGGETRAQYYTNDTPISAADSTLSSGKFTGYIELSENVLSGDYYVVYYGGKSMSVAYVGNSRKLLTGDEAFERADDEVGIYKVNEASIEIVDIPEPEPEPEPVVTDDASTDATDATADAGVDSVANEDATDDTNDAIGAGVTFDGTDGVDEADVEAPETTATTDDVAVAADVDEAGEMAEEDASVARADDAADAEPSADPAPASEQAVADAADPTSAADTGTTESTEAAGSDATAQAAEAAEQSVEPAAEPASAPDADAVDEDPLAASSAAANGEADEDVFSEEAQWREATSIPALDPQDSAAESGESGTTVQEAAVRRRDESARSQRRTRQQQSEQTQKQRRQRQAERTSAESETTPQVGQLKARLEAVAEEKSELESARERLVAEVDRLEDERDRVASERDEYREQAEALESRVSSLEAEVDRLEAELEAEVEAARVADGPGGGVATETMSAEAALDGTNLFVRYGSKSGGTLEKAHAGEVNRSEVNENLRLEHHTGFETEGVAVDGEPYEEFLHGSIEYGFVRWVVEDLLYEIRETGNRGSLDELFDAIPKVDRAELHGDVTLKYTEGGEEHREQQSFDVVLRDRMGNPLLVANLNGSRDPASEGMMRSLVEHTSRLRESNESLGAAFLVTASYFSPDALETAADATGGGLLSRGRRKSFVKLSRKQGFHLCLVETRNGDFHVNVPEL